MSEVINQQRKLKIDSGQFQLFTDLAINIIPQASNKFVTVAFVSDRKIRELNKAFRGKNYATDVLSFPFEADEFDANESFLGDIIISVERAETQAAENNLDLETEIKQLILHGILHLCGYDHEVDNGEMNTLELKLRDKLGI